MLFDLQISKMFNGISHIYYQLGKKKQKGYFFDTDNILTYVEVLMNAISKEYFAELRQRIISQTIRLLEQRYREPNIKIILTPYPKE